MGSKHDSREDAALMADYEDRIAALEAENARLRADVDVLESGMDCAGERLATAEAALTAARRERDVAVKAVRTIENRALKAESALAAAPAVAKCEHGAPAKECIWKACPHYWEAAAPAAGVGPRLPNTCGECECAWGLHMSGCSAAPPSASAGQGEWLWLRCQHISKSDERCTVCSPAPTPSAEVCVMCNPGKGMARVCDACAATGEG